MASKYHLNFRFSNTYSKLSPAFQLWVSCYYAPSPFFCWGICFYHKSSCTKITCNFFLGLSCALNIFLFFIYFLLLSYKRFL